MVVIDWFPGLLNREKVIKANRLVKEFTIEEIDFSALDREKAINVLQSFGEQPESQLPDFIFITHNKTFEEILFEFDIKFSTVVILPSEKLLESPEYHDAILNDNRNIDNLDEKTVIPVAREFHKKAKENGLYLVSVDKCEYGIGTNTLTVLANDMLERFDRILSSQEEESEEEEIDTGSFDENGRRIPEEENE